MKGWIPVLLAVAVIGRHTAAAAEPATLDTGRSAYRRHCAPCHAKGGAGAVLIGRRLGATRAVLEDRSDLPATYLRAVVRRGIAGMPWLTPVELPDGDLDALVAYLTRNAPAE